jgi:DNA topoisomerase-3
LISNLKELKLDFLIAPQLTAQWEEKLGNMEKGVGLSRHEFLVELTTLVNKSIETLKASAQEKGIVHRSGYQTQEVDTGILCPVSGEKIIDRGSFWQFPAYPNARFYKEIAKKTLDLSQMIEILKGQSPLISGFVSKKGAKFAARLEFNKGEEKLKFVFDQESGIVAQDCDVLCPKSGKPISDHGQFWTFPDNPTKFWKLVAKRKMKLSDYVDLIKDGKTKVFDNFVSKAGNKFSASMVLSNNQVSFEFPERGRSMSPSMPGPGAKGSKKGSNSGSSSGSSSGFSGFRGSKGSEGNKKSKKTW